LENSKTDKNYEQCVHTEHHYVNESIAQFSKDLFKLDEGSRIILSVIAQHGPLNGRKIAKFGITEWSHTFSYDIVKNKMGARNHSPNLIDSGFVIQKEGKSIGNISKVREKIYFLTLKGMLASVAEIKLNETVSKKIIFEENYLINDHKKRIKSWLKNDIPEFAIQFIKYNIALFLLKHKILNSDLTELDNIESQISSMNEEIFLDYRIPAGNKELYEKSVCFHTMFRVYSQVLNEAFKQVLSETIIKRKKSKGKIIDGGGYLPPIEELPRYVGNFYNRFVKYWYINIIQNQYQDENKFEPFLIGEKIRRQKLIPLKIDNSNVNRIAKQILEEHGIDSNFDLSQEPKFFTDS
jgi:hypothetical protein